MKKSSFRVHVPSEFPHPKIGYGILSVIIFACAIFFLTGIRAEGAEERAADEVIGYESVLVRCGDSLWSIAEANMMDPTNAQIQAYVEEIVSLNDITSSRIHAGKYILLPKHR